MLSAREIEDRISEKRAADRLWIVPVPDVGARTRRGATSVDLRLGRWFRSFRQNRDSHYQLYREPSNSHGERDPDRRPLSTSEHFVDFGKAFVLHPGRFVLGVTLEWLKLPGDISGYVTGKSSLGRHGLVIETAAGIQPNFSGCLTLELANMGEVPLKISPGMRVCQIFLHATTKTESEDRGTFSGMRKPGIGLVNDDDKVFEKLCDRSKPPS